jgi:hypothetical protein
VTHLTHCHRFLLHASQVRTTGPSQIWLAKKAPIACTMTLNSLRPSSPH